MNLINLTPHSVTVLTENGRVVIPPSGDVAENPVMESFYDNFPYEDTNIPVNVCSIAAEVEGLPAWSPFKFYIVSSVVRESFPHRTDLLSPGGIVRNHEGQPMGCRNLICNKQ